MARDCKKQPRFGKFYRPQKPKHRIGMDVLTLHPLDLTDHGFKTLLVMFVCVCVAGSSFGLGITSVIVQRLDIQ